MKMNDRITPLLREVGVDAAGQPVETWVALPEVWGDALFQTGAEVVRANAETTVKKVSLWVWANSGIDEAMRVRLFGVDYGVKSAMPDSKDRRFMFLVCESVK